MSRSIVITASAAAHVALILGLGSLQVDRSQAATAIEVFEVQKAPPPPEPPPPEPAPEQKPPEPEPPPPPQPPKETRKPERAPKAEPPAAQDEPAEAPLDALPDLGLDLSGTSSAAASGGMAVRQGTGPKGSTVRKTLQPARRIDECKEPIGKAKALDLPRPAHTPAALSAGIFGKVRVRFTVDPSGKVASAEVLEGLGYGLDEAALAAIRAARFEPALHCGKAVSSTLTVSVRFDPPR